MKHPLLRNFCRADHHLLL